MRGRPANNLLVLTWALLALGVPAWAWSPRVTQVEPRGVQRGERCELRISGERLGAATSLLFDGEGIEVDSIRPEGEGLLVVALRSAADCDLGEHRFWVVGPRGLSEMATLRVGAFPLVDESESNDMAAKAQVVQRADGVTIRGVIDEADVDCFAVELAEGGRLSLDVEAMRLGAAFFDAYIDIVGPDGAVVASADDDPLSRQDPRLSYVARNAGRHVVRVREAAFGGDFESRYQLHVGDFPVVSTALPAGGPPGQRLITTLLGDARGPLEVRMDLPLDPLSGWTAHRPNGPKESPTPLPLRVAEVVNVLESETPEAAAPPLAFNGVLSERGEVDRMTFNVTAGETLAVETFAARIGSPLDTVIEVEGPHGPLLENDDDGVVHDSCARFRAVETGLHKLTIRDHLGRGGPTHAYRVEVTRVEPSLTLTTPILNELRPQESQRLHVPRGGRTAVLIAARRDRFDGPITIDAGDLPDGVRATIDPIPPGEHLTVAMLEADTDAPLGATLARITGYGDSRSGTVTGSLQHDVGLVFGEPRRTVYYGATIDRTPIAVTEPLPFKVSVDRPSSPLARDGRKDLTVRVERQPGFDGPITLSSPRLPEWVERSEDPVRIEPGQFEVAFPLIATDRATPGEYSVVLVGTARVEGAEVSVASDRTTISIVAPMAEVKIARTTAEQGSQADVACELEWLANHGEQATATLLGLPKHATSPSVRVSPGQSELIFPVRVGPETPEALHNSLYVELAVGDPAEPVRQHLGRGGVLEVVAPGGVARRQISRLEELRREAAPRRTKENSRG